VAENAFAEEACAIEKPEATGGEFSTHEELPFAQASSVEIILEAFGR
jgi:hypothetical protein